ncbi:MAG: restriction endonuclease [Candidatus Aenigmatarchaeota archaeon]|nr:MAG: restriction endonuclease [Candidatus Aenigmarchaeota archaeon]
MNKINEGIEILTKMGLPRQQQNERSALTLLAVVNMKPTAPWREAQQRIIRIHDILLFIEKEYNKKYAENTRETIRRQTIHQLEQAGLLMRNSDDPQRPTNSPNTVYSISNEALNAVKAYGSQAWEESLHGFISAKGRLVERYDRKKKKNQLTLKIAEKQAIYFSPGKHNELQIAIIEKFKPRFSPNSDLIYVGDTARKLLHENKKAFETLNIPITQHDKLPDVVLYDKGNNHLLLVEAVTSHGPISPKRHVELEGTLSKCKAQKIYISAFLDIKEFKRHIDNIAWDTEVWVATNPDHMIHFNGPKFFTTY